MIALLLVAAASVNADEPPRLSFAALALGAQGRTDLGIGMIEARVTLSPHLQLTAAPTVLAPEGAETEQQLRVGATLLWQPGSIRIDDRNNWTFSDAGTTRYRNRLRLTVPVDIGGQSVRLQLLDEVFYEEGGRGWFRNLAGVGIGLDVDRSFSVDAYWYLQDDDRRPRASLFIVMLTVPIASFELRRR